MTEEVLLELPENVVTGYVYVTVSVLGNQNVILIYLGQAVSLFILKSCLHHVLLVPLVTLCDYHVIHICLVCRAPDCPQLCSPVLVFK